MTDLDHDLPDGTLEWVAQTGGGEVTRLYRHVARREAWVVDVTRPDGSVLEGFLRLERGPHGKGPSRLERETRITQALADTAIPVTRVHGFSPELHATLFARDPGRSDIDKLEDARRQRALMEDLIRAVARMHQLDLDALGLDDVMPPRPTTPVECAIDCVDRTLAEWKHFLDGYTDPFTTYAVDWLRRFVPKQVARVSLVQGDTGPVNFMFQGDRVSALVDWETAHYGDPLEDLGNICVREFWNPSGGLTGLFELYARESGIPYTRFAAQYYSVQQNVRGMIPIHYVSVNAHPRESIAWYLCYRYVGDRATCEMIAQAMEIEVDRPSMPEESGESDILADAAVFAQEQDVAAKLEDPFALSRAKDVKTLVRCMDRRRRYGAALAEIEIDELAALLGRRPASLEEGVHGLLAAIGERRLDDERLVPYFTRKAYRDEWLFAPAAELYPERRWAVLD